MSRRSTATAFLREVDMYPALLRLFAKAGLGVAEVPFFGKRMDLVFASQSFVNFCSIETKMQDWRIAFKQAAVNQLAAQRSFIAVPWRLAMQLLKHEADLFSMYDVGLIGVDRDARVLLRPRKNGCFSLRHYQMLKTTVRAVASKRPKRIGVVADAIAERSKTLVVLQTRAN